MKFRTILLLLFGALLLVTFGVRGDRGGWYGMADDADGDGVPDSVDVCPAEDASFFDALAGEESAGCRIRCQTPP